MIGVLCAWCYLMCVQSWCQSGADVNWPSYETGATALILASEAEDKEVKATTVLQLSGACHRGGTMLQGSGMLGVAAS